MATGPVYLSLFLLHSLSLHPVRSRMRACRHVRVFGCTLALRTLLFVLLCCIKVLLFIIVSIITVLLSFQTKVFSRCRYGTADESRLPPVLSCCCLAHKKTICLILGDTHTSPQLGCTQIICYTSMPFFSPLPLFISQSFSPFFPFLSPFILSSGGDCHSSNSHICEVSAGSDK